MYWSTGGFMSASTWSVYTQTRYKSQRYLLHCWFWSVGQKLNHSNLILHISLFRLLSNSHRNIVWCGDDLVMAPYLLIVVSDVVTNRWSESAVSDYCCTLPETCWYHIQSIQPLMEHASQWNARLHWFKINTFWRIVAS